MKCATNLLRIGAMVELVDTPVLGTGLLRGEGSSPFRPTKQGKYDYDDVYDSSCLSTKRDRKVWLYNKKGNFGSLRNQYFRM